MLRSLILMLGVASILLGCCCLIVDKVVLTDEFLVAVSDQTERWFSRTPQAEIDPPQWVAFNFLILGVLTTLYSSAIPEVSAAA